MELVCEKNRKNINSYGAKRQHPTEYCKFRTACIIHFMSKETAAEEQKGEDAESPAEGETDGAPEV